MKKFYLFAAALSVLVACEKNNGTDDEPQDNNFEEFEDHFVYYGESYNIVTLKNGATWMAENLRYVPEGKTVSETPGDNAGVWYPYEIKDGAAVVLKDEASIKEKGYLYDMETALGATVTVDNLKTFEGEQGICPEGWHIATRADWVNLCGYSTKAEGEDGPLVKEDALYYDAGYKGGKMTSFADKHGLNINLCGYINQANITATASYYVAKVLSSDQTPLTEYHGDPAVSYYMSSTGYKALYKPSDPTVLNNIQFFGLMSTFNLGTYPEGKISVSYVCYKAALPVRCVKDAE